MKSKFLLACIFFSPILWAQQQLIGFNFGGGLNGNGNIFSINTNGTNYQIKASFPFAYGSGNSVQIADGYDGFYYGISFGDGYNDAGSIFKIRYNGTNYTVLRKLQRNIDGGSPRFKPVIAPDGFLYGVCEDGGLFRNGTIWKMAIDGSSFTVLKHFNIISEGTEGFFGSLTLGIDGLLYGVTGGNFGHLFSVSTNGSRFTKLISFTGNGSIKGASPRTPLVQDAEGFLWGTTYGGGQNDKGTLFKFHPRTLVFSTIKQFTGSDGTRPSTSLLEIGNEMYGACDNEGQNGDNGTLWKINKNGNNFLVIKYLDVAFTGGRCSNSLYWHNDGFIYGSLQSYGPRNMGTIFKIQPNGNNFTVLRETHLGNGAANQLLFNQTNQQFYAVIMGGPSNGGALISYNNYFNTDKYIYGFNYYHEGAKPSGVPLVINNAASSQYGKVFGNTLTGYLNNGLLFSAYTQQNNQQHKIVLPYTANFGYSSSTRFGLIMGSDGYLYGCMENGGGLVWGQSDGTVFRVNPADTTDKSIVKYFNNTNTNALQPIYLLEGIDGFLYGIARMGGNNNRGTIFKMNKDGSNYQNIYHTGGTNSLLSITSIIFDAVTEQLIGTGTNNNYEECIFTISNSGNNLTTIKTFVPANANMEGNDLQPTLTLVGDTLYGSMKRGGNSSLGSIFKINKNGSGFSVIYLFTATTIGNPLGALQIDENGFVYGTCSGSYNSTSAGSGIFKIHSSGHSFSILRQFSNNATDINGIIPGSVVLVPCNTPNNASNINFGRATNSSITVNGFDEPASGGTNGYIVKINTINNFSNPANGSIPSANTHYSGTGEQVVFVGNSPAAFTVTGLQPNTTYWFKVFAFGCAGNLYNSNNTTNNPNSIRTPPIGIGNTNLMARFDGINDAVIAADINAIEGQTSISFGGWIKPFSFPEENFALKSFIAKGDAVNAATTTLQAGFLKDDGSLVNVQAMLNINGQLYKVSVPIDSSMFRLNTWSHYFVSWQNNQPIKLYINGRVVAQSPIAVTGVIHNSSALLRLGSSDAGLNEKGFHGDMEEVQLYNTALSECTIRQRMHILLTGNERNLISYYQFNENNSLPLFNDYVGEHHGTKQNGVLALPSDLSAGNGISDCFLATSSTANYFFNSSDFSNGIQLFFPGMMPNGLMNISYIESAPVGGNPNPGSNMLPGYWIINNFGTNTSNLAAQITFRLPNGRLTDTSLSNYRLYKRASNGSGNWELFPISGISLAPNNYSITINNIPSFSQFVLTSTTTVLPLQLINFSGELANNQPMLNWTTANETNMIGYTLERQINGSTLFDSIAFIKANNQAYNSYTYKDIYMQTPGNYTYRLKMHDKDGTTSWSKVISFKIQATMNVQVFPNPASNETYLSIPETEGKIMVKLIGTNGQIVGSYLFNTGTHKIWLQHLPKGIYQLIFSNNKQIFTPKTLIKL